MEQTNGKWCRQMKNGLEKWKIKWTNGRMEWKNRKWNGQLENGMNKSKMEWTNGKWNK